MGIDHLISRRPRVSNCVKCKCNTLVAIAEGLPIRVDPLPLSIPGEILAIMQGRRTYGVYAEGYLCLRSAGRMRTDAKYKLPMILCSHVCGSPLVSAVDSGYVAQMIEFMHKRLNPNPDTTHDQAMFSVADLLYGKVIDDNDPPF